MKSKILLIALIISVFLTGCESKKKEESKQVVETNGMLSYTIDGEVAKEKPTKEDGYFVNKIVCDSGTDMMWDNDNWEVELTKVESSDRCMVDFTKDINKEGYRVTVKSNNTLSLDSLSKATTQNGTIKIYSSSIIESVTGCNGVIDGNKVIISNVNSNQTCHITIEDKTLAGTIKNAYNADINRKRTNFTLIDNSTHVDTPAGLTGGLYAGIDDQETTYYFSGDGSGMNNWVSFAGKLWRIIRINGNGSVRLLYAGDGTTANDIGSSAYNSTYYHPQYVGWKYTSGNSLSTNRGNGTKSTIYSKVETWYTTNITNAGLTNYIDTGAIYCNDRNLRSGDSYSTSATFYYAAYGRLVDNKAPTFNCSNTSDRFYNFGLMTADEVSYAGGLYGTNNASAYYYLAQDGTSSITGGSYWWTMSPSYWDGSHAVVFIVGGSLNPGNLTASDVNRSNVVRPVVSLKSNVLVTGGSGTASYPYTLTIE